MNYQAPNAPQGPGSGYYAAPGGRQEIPIFSSGGVQVTSARFMCWQQTYPMGGITSVAPFTIYASKNGPQFLAFWSGLWCVVWAIYLCMGGGGGAFAMLLFSAACLAGCIWWTRSLKDSYGVMITTAGMNVRAVISPDVTFVHAIVAALNQALAMR